MADLPSSAGGGFLSSRVIHLHPSRRCNIACYHCYSSSGPDLQGELSPDIVLPALATLREEGYEVLSLSGGEPLLYTGLEEVLRGATSLGYRVSMITNGAALGGRLLNLVGEHVNLVAVSLDGAPETHNRLRGDVRAFGWVERAAERLSDAGIRYGLSYCVSRESLGDMPWAAQFAVDKGAGMIQFHPFGSAGRGRLVASSLCLSKSDKARAFVTAKLLGKFIRVAIQLDLVPTKAALERRSDYGLPVGVSSHVSLADLVNPLVIDETGLVLPLSYGMHRGLAIGHVNQELEYSVEQFKVGGVRTFQDLFQHAFVRLEKGQEVFIDWFQHLVETSFLLSKIGQERTLSRTPIARTSSELVKEKVSSDEVS